MTAAHITAMVDAAMVEMENVHPPLKRSECERLICAVLNGAGPAEPRPAIPPGWTIRPGRRDGEIVVSGPNGKPGTISLSPVSRWLENRILYELAAALMEPKP